MIIPFIGSDYIALEDVLAKIAIADDCDLSEITQAVLSRYRELSPDQSIHFLSLPMDPEEQIQYYERIIELLKAHPVETK